jgi:2-phospho-L-lactate/phosphoenolpyruvate guanylyltransferase
VTTPLAIVPFRAPGAGKTRLAPTLAPPARAVLARAMLTDVVAALAAAEVRDVIVAAGGAAAAAAARQLHVGVVTDRATDGGLDIAIANTLATRPDADEVLVVAADLPCLTAEDVRAVLASPAGVVIAPTAGGGTGGLLRRAGHHITTAYGRDSAARHRAAALAAGATVDTLHLDGFAHDVDTWADLVALHDVEVGAATAAVLPDLLLDAAAARC